MTLLCHIDDPHGVHVKSQQATLLKPADEIRLRIIYSVIAHQISARDAAITLRLSLRQVYRLISRIKANGEQGLIHGNRGKTPWNKFDEQTVGTILNLAQEYGLQVSFSTLREDLARQHGILMHRETLRRYLRRAGVYSSRTTSANTARRTDEEGFPFPFTLCVSDRGKLLSLKDGTSLALLIAVHEHTGYTWAWLCHAANRQKFCEPLRKTLLLNNYSGRIKIHGLEIVREDDLATGNSGSTDLTNWICQGISNSIVLYHCCTEQHKCSLESKFMSFQNKLTRELKKADTLTICVTLPVLMKL